MSTLLSKKDWLKRILISSACMALILIVSVVMAKAFSHEKADARTADGSTVMVSYGPDEINYGNGSGWHTHLFTINSSITAFCANPILDAISGEQTAEIYNDGILGDKGNSVKLLLYAATHYNDNTILSTFMHSLYDSMLTASVVDNNPNQVYAYVHATLGYIYPEVNKDTTGLSESEVQAIQDIAVALENAVRDNSDAWVIARDSVLYWIQGSSGYQDLFWVEEDQISGTIEVDKCDKETNACAAQDGASLSGIKFELFNSSDKSIYYNGTIYADDASITTKTTGNDGTVSFTGLPAGTYTVKEKTTNASYILDTTGQNASIVNNGDSVTLKFYDDIVRGNIKFTKVDQNNNAMANIPFVITNTASTEQHVVVSDPNGVVETKIVSPLSNNNKYDDYLNGQATSITYNSSYGVLFNNKKTYSVQPGVDRGALPYGNYTIKELACDQNHNCYGIGETEKTFSITSDSVTPIDLSDPNVWENDCAELSIETKATNKENGTQYIEAKTNVTISDEVTYKVKKDTNYIIKGKLMYGDTVIKEATSNSFGSSSGQGSVTIDFNIDASELEMGSHLVVYEYLYEGTSVSPGATPVASHEDPSDSHQIIYIAGINTEAHDTNGNGDHFIEAKANAKVYDHIYYCLSPAAPHTIKGTLYDIDDGREVATATINRVIGTNSCQEDSMEFEFDATGLAGHRLVVHEEILRANIPITTHVDNNDADQTIYVISLGTSATDNSDGDKILAYDQDVEIKDTIKYCLVEGEKFTITGVLMDKSTKKPLEVDGEPVTQTITVTPEEQACGEAEMIFPLNTSSLSGAEIVVFESVYLGEPKEDDDPIIAHEDIDDEAQTVTVAPETPDTGKISTGNQNGSENGINFIILAIAGGIGSCISIGFMIGKRFFNKTN